MTIVQPKQERSRKTLEALLKTGVRLLKTGNPSDLRIEEVVSKAGSSIGSFYARFPSKSAYLEALAERLESDLSERLDKLVDGESSPTDVVGMAEALVDALSEEGRQRSALRRADGEIAKRGRQTDRRVIKKAVAAFGRAGVTDMDKGQRATELLVAAVDGASQTFATDESRTALLSELPAIMVSYLKPPPARTFREPVDPFDVWA